MTHAIDLMSARNADITTIKAMLEEQRARRLDLVVSPDMIRAERGRLVVLPGEATQILTGSGVVSAAGYYLPTDVADEGLGTMLGIDGGYLKRLRDRDPSRTDVWDANVNLMLHGSESPFDPEAGLEGIAPEFPGYGKNLLLRMLKGDDEADGVLRAVRSPRFRVDMDNLDVLLAVLEGFREAGVNAVPDVCDLSSRSMRVRFAIPAMAAMAPKLLDGYRSPLDDGEGHGVKRAGELNPEDGGDRPGMRLRVDSRWRNWTVSDAFRAAHMEGMGYKPGEEPVVFAGIEVTCSDVGEGGRNIFPKILVRACKNGLTLVAEADKRSHLGAEKQAGVIQVSAATDAAELELIRNQTKDAVKTFTSEEWFLGQVQEIEALAGVKVNAPEQVIQDVTRANGFTKAEAAGIWDMFLMSGGTTEEGSAGQVANAITAYSQTVKSPDRAAEMDRAAVPVMKHLARIAA